MAILFQKFNRFNFKFCWKIFSPYINETLFTINSFKISYKNLSWHRLISSSGFQIMPHQSQKKKKYMFIEKFWPTTSAEIGTEIPPGKDYHKFSKKALFRKKKTEDIPLGFAVKLNMKYHCIFRKLSFEHNHLLAGLLATILKINLKTILVKSFHKILQELL